MKNRELDRARVGFWTRGRGCRCNHGVCPGHRGRHVHIQANSRAFMITLTMYSSLTAVTARSDCTLIIRNAYRCNMHMSTYAHVDRHPAARDALRGLGCQAVRMLARRGSAARVCIITDYDASLGRLPSQFYNAVVLRIQGTMPHDLTILIVHVRTGTCTARIAILVASHDWPLPLQSDWLAVARAEHAVQAPECRDVPGRAEVSMESREISTDLGDAYM